MLYVVIDDADKLSCTIDYMKSRDEARYWSSNLLEKCSESKLPITLLVDDEGELRKKYDSDNSYLTHKVVPKYIQSGWSVETADVLEDKPPTVTIDGRDYLLADVERLLEEIKKCSK